jgi:hypothetical protein
LPFAPPVKRDLIAETSFFAADLSFSRVPNWSLTSGNQLRGLLNIIDT